MATLFVSCAPYIENLLLEELRELGYSNVRMGFRGVYVTVSGIEAIYKINYCSRLAQRVLLPLKQFFCKGRDALYKETSSIDWSNYFQKAKNFAIDAHVDPSIFRSSLFAAQVVKDAICDQLREKTGKRPDVKSYEPDLQLNLFMDGPKTVLSIDTSGIPLHKRGYRQETAEAPLQETLAAALLRIAKYSGKEVLYDPCCGSGTLLIEAAMIASKTPPQFFRHKFGFMQLPEFDEIAWLKVKNLADSQKKSLIQNHIVGTDINKNAVRICISNLRATGFFKEIKVLQGDFREVSLPFNPNFVIANPPYGNRLSEEPSLKGLYRSLGDMMKQKTEKPAKGFILTGNLELSKEVGLAPKQRHVLENGGIEARFLEFDLY